MTVSRHAVSQVVLSRLEPTDTWTRCILQTPPTTAGLARHQRVFLVLSRAAFNVTLDGADDPTWKHLCVLDEHVRLLVS